MPRRHSGTKLYSLRKRLLHGICLFIVPILAILLICVYGLTKSFEGQINSYIEESVRPFTTELETTFSLISRFVVTQDPDFSFMNKMYAGQNPEDVLNVKSIGESIASQIDSYPGIDAFFFYNHDQIWFVHNYNRSYAECYAIADHLKPLISKESDNNGTPSIFQILETETGYYLYLDVVDKDGIFGIWLSQDRLLSEIRNSDAGGFKNAYFSYNNTVLLDSNNTGGTLEAIQDAYQGDYITALPITGTPLSLVVIWETKEVFSSYYRMLRIVVAWILISYIIAAFFVLYIYRVVLKPIRHMEEVISQVDAQRIESIPIEEKTPSEIAGVYKSLNTLIHDIKALKIQMYEEKLRKQSVEVQLYQMQLRPHFFLNALNNMISSARIGDFKNVEEIGINLAAHCKYILYHTKYVYLDEELDYTRKYVDMCILQGKKINRYTENIEEEALDCEVPVLCIQIFVENVVKYGANKQNEIEITINAHKNKGRDRLLITIEDTGSGFKNPDDVISSINEKNGHGIGIGNITRRLELLYNGKASLDFRNKEEGGAVVLLNLPIACETEDYNQGDEL